MATVIRLYPYCSDSSVIVGMGNPGTRVPSVSSSRMAAIRRYRRGPGEMAAMADTLAEPSS
jgi:hypothetical protein